MAAVKDLLTDFATHINTLSKKELVSLLLNLVDDRDGLTMEQMHMILYRAGVKGYERRIVTVAKYTKEEAVAQSIKMGGNGRVGQRTLVVGEPYWTDLDTGELWHAHIEE